MAAGSESSPNRMPWCALPPGLRERIEARIGSRVVRAGLAAGGFSAGYAGVLELADGRRVFVKAGDGATNAQTAEFHQREAEIAGALPPGVGPALQWSLRWEEWVVLAFTAIDGRQPGSPWTEEDLAAVLGAPARLAALPAPPRLESHAARLAETLTGWSRLRAADAGGHVPEWAAQRVDELAAYEGAAIRRAVEGDAIVHFDLRSDNILMRGEDVWLLDWPHAGRGAPWLDVVFFAPTVPLEGGPSAAEVFRRSPVAGSVDPADLRTMVSGWAGWLLWASGEPDPPGIPHLRAFQRAQAATTLDWLRLLLAP